MDNEGIDIDESSEDDFIEENPAILEWQHEQKMKKEGKC